MEPWLPGPLAAVSLSHFMVLTCFPVLVLKAQGLCEQGEPAWRSEGGATLLGEHLQLPTAG